MEHNKEHILKDFIQREIETNHTPYAEEVSFYTAVQAGNVEYVKNSCNERAFSHKAGFGTLSYNAVRNLRYHFIISIALISRFCVEGGLEHEAAYRLSDYYIQKVDKCTSIEDISKLHIEMCIDYTTQMKQLQYFKIYSKPIVLCIDYIYANLQNRIKIKELATHVGLNESYLSLLFKKETGYTVSNYIMLRKIMTAENMLKYSDYSYTDIANLLAFTSQSYFIKVFKKETGVTPREYRNAHFRDIGIFKEKKI